MTSAAAIIAENLQDIRRRMKDACSRSGRDPGEVKLVSVTKSATPEWIGELIALGETDLGESRPQQLLDRASLFQSPVRWHLIGSLQRNKVRRVLSVADLIHSVDSLRLLESIDRIAAEINQRTRVLLEVNVSGEEAKHGFRPKELLDSVDELAALRHVEIRGLMTMAPLVEDAESARHVFRGLRQLREHLAQRSESNNLHELSMGMSNDFEIAIEEGATLVRVGSDLFRNLDASHS